MYSFKHLETRTNVCDGTILKNGKKILKTGGFKQTSTSVIPAAVHMVADDGSDCYGRSLYWDGR